MGREDKIWPGLAGVSPELHRSLPRSSRVLRVLGALFESSYVRLKTKWRREGRMTRGQTLEALFIGTVKSKTLGVEMERLKGIRIAGLDLRNRQICVKRSRSLLARYCGRNR